MLPGAEVLLEAASYLVIKRLPDAAPANWAAAVAAAGLTEPAQTASATLPRVHGSRAVLGGAVRCQAR